ncbi:DUF2306 domain-containing protein [Devosia sp. 1635]|uniref:DUF2306 domain-containing protein n=1 Tax=Devosia sp. 1635 TaxID=2726066 RepID=UPI001565878D|nr:DUF2306 domain-containing protein [Devosia sp. 1635]
MDTTPIIASSLAIQIHALSALAAVLLGTIVLFARKGTRLHMRLGRMWVGVMVVVALSSFLISEMRMFGPYSLIHALSVLTLVSLIVGIVAIRRGNLKAHRFIMISLYVFALVLTGAFTLLPGRRMHAVIFADGGQTAAVLATLIATLIGVLLLVRRRYSRA